MNERTLIYYLGNDRADLWQTIAWARERGSATVVNGATTLDDDADLADVTTDVARLHVGELSSDERLGHARELAWAWFAEVGTRRPTPIGPMISDFVRDDEDATLWWSIDVSFQERAFLGVRFVEMLDALLRRIAPTVIVVCGTDPNHPWQITIARRWARARRVRWVAAPSQRREAAARTPLRVRRPIPPRWHARRGQAGILLPTAPLPQPAEALLRLAQLLALPFGALAAAGVLLSAAVTNARTPRRIPETSRRYVRRLIDVGLFLVVVVLAFVAFVPAALAILVIGLVWIVTVDRPERLPHTANDVLDLVRRVDTRVVVRRKGPASGAAALGTPGSAAMSRATTGVVLTVEDIENEKRRVDSRGRRSTYNPYAEGVVESVAARLGRSRVVRVKYGSPHRSRTARILLRLRRLLPGAPMWVTDELTPELLQAADRRAAVARTASTALLALPALNHTLAYDGVSLLSVLGDQIREIFANVGSVQLYIDAYRSLIRRLRPDVVLSYNWDGVFRPLTEAAYREGVPLVGVQQALGPYGHGLDHRDVGYVRPGERGDGFRIPTRFAAWGSVHRRNLISYGWPNDAVRVTGYARLDPYAGRAPDRDRVLSRLSIRDRDATLLLFTPVLYLGPLRMGLMRESDYFALFDSVVDLAESDPHLFVAVKPWAGDDLGRLEELVRVRGTERVRFVPPSIDLHNADLLRVSRLLVGTFSSIMGEAVAAGCMPILIDFPACRYYFGDAHVEEFRGLARFTSTVDEALAAVREELSRSASDRDRARQEATGRLEQLFGPPDGHAADRISELVEELLASAPNRQT